MAAACRRSRTRLGARWLCRRRRSDGSRRPRPSGGRRRRGGRRRCRRRRSRRRVRRSRSRGGSSRRGVRRGCGSGDRRGRRGHRRRRGARTRRRSWSDRLRSRLRNRLQRDRRACRLAGRGRSRRRLWRIRGLARRLPCLRTHRCTTSGNEAIQRDRATPCLHSTDHRAPRHAVKFQTPSRQEYLSAMLIMSLPAVCDREPERRMTRPDPAPFAGCVSASSTRELVQHPGFDPVTRSCTARRLNACEDVADVT